LQHCGFAVLQKQEAVDRKSSVWRNSGFSFRNNKMKKQPPSNFFSPFSQANPKWQDKQLKRFFSPFFRLFCLQFNSNNETAALQASHNNAVEVAAAIKSKSLSESETEMVEARMVERATHLAEKCAYYGLDVHGEYMMPKNAQIGRGQVVC
jgi:hypothetical protein